MLDYFVMAQFWTPQVVINNNNLWSWERFQLHFNSDADAIAYILNYDWEIYSGGTAAFRRVQLFNAEDFRLLIDVQFHDFTR